MKALSEIEQSLDGKKNYIVGVCCVLAAVFGVFIPESNRWHIENDSATLLFWGGVALMTGRDALDKVIRNLEQRNGGQ